jgi:hypothetical protein
MKRFQILCLSILFLWLLNKVTACPLPLGPANNLTITSASGHLLCSGSQDILNSNLIIDDGDVIESIPCSASFLTMLKYNLSAEIYFTVLDSQIVADTINISACDSYTWNDSTYTESGIYSWTGINAAGSDSVVTLNLTINQTPTSSFYIDNYGIGCFNNYLCSVPGFASVNYAGNATSDATFELIVQGVPNFYNNVIPLGHGNYQINFILSNGNFFLNVPIGLIVTENGCVSPQTTIDVGVLPFVYDGSSFNIVSESLCVGEAILFQATPIENPFTFPPLVCPNEYRWTWDTEAGSESEWGQSNFKEITWTTGGIKNISLTTSYNGCFSNQVTQQVYINQPSASTETASACGSYIWNGNTYNQSGIYNWTGNNSAGCDSLVSLLLTINPSVSFSPSNTTFCNNSTSVDLIGGIPSGGVYSGAGVSNGSFNPATAGSGSHSITYTYSDENGCSNSSSAVFEVAVCTGMETFAQPVLEVRPNPMESSTLVSLKNYVGSDSQFNLILMDATGRKVFEKRISAEVIREGYLLQIPELASGTYFLMLNNSNYTAVKRLVK